MNIIGFSATGHDDSICLIENGEIINHFQLERYTRLKKNNTKKIFAGNPKSKIQKIIYNTCDYILNKKINKNYIITTSLCGVHNEKLNYFYKKNILSKDKNNKKHLKEPKKFNDYIMINENVYFIDHHVAHAAYAYYTSDFKESDILAYDGGGHSFQSIFIDSRQNIINVGYDSEINPDFWIGILWRVICNHYFGKFTDSYGKMMGYSAYGKVNEFLLEKLEYLSTIINQVLFPHHFYDSGLKIIEKKNIFTYEDYLASIFLNNIIEPEDAFATLQYFSQELVLKNLKKHRTSDNLCISGGCALNGYINEEILKRKIYKRIHVPPAASDEGQSIGTALHALYNLYGKRIKIDNPNKLMYLGEEYNINLESSLNDDELLVLIAKKISEGYVIGWYQGKGESGPRALGNRSILADPRNEKMQNHINFKIKNREWYRPFAPSILREYVDDWFKTNGDSDAPYMTRILEYKKGKEKKVPATCHIDNTARIQTVTEDINPRYYKLIKEFFKITNIPILLNTSFNGRGEPMVETPKEALKCFRNNNIDILVIGNCVYYRDNNENIKPFIEESNVDGNDR